MAQLDSTKTVEPFGEVNVFQEADGSIRVKATILMRPQVEGAQTGLAIDGSNSMNQMFGASGAVSALFASASNNIVQPVARMMAEYLANFDSDGNTTVIYWACGIGGGDIQELGDMNAAQAKSNNFIQPKAPGTGTKLLPAIKYFTTKPVARKSASMNWMRISRLNQPSNLEGFTERAVAGNSRLSAVETMEGSKAFSRNTPDFQQHTRKWQSI